MKMAQAREALEQNQHKKKRKKMGGGSDRGDCRLRRSDQDVRVDLRRPLRNSSRFRDDG